MKLAIRIPDKVYEVYEARSLTHPGASPETFMAEQLARFAHVDGSDRILVVDSDSRRVLETILQGGHLLSPQDLVDKVRALADIKIHGISVDFTPGELGELKRRADKNNITVAEEVRRVVEIMKGDFMGRLV